MLRWMVTECERFPTCLLSFPFSQFEQFIKFSLANIFLFEREILLDETAVLCLWCRLYYIISQVYFQLCTIK